MSKLTVKLALELLPTYALVPLGKRMFKEYTNDIAKTFKSCSKGHDFLEGLGGPRVLKALMGLLGFEGDILSVKKALEEFMIFSILKNDTENITRITGFFEIASNF